MPVSFAAPCTRETSSWSSFSELAISTMSSAYLRLFMSRPLVLQTLRSVMRTQASYMPIKHGGPGIRRVSSLAAPAFLASAASTLVLQEQILAQFLYPQTHFLNHISHLGPIQLGHLRIRCGIVVSMPWCPVFER